MSTAAYNKRRYRLDPKARAAILASNQRSREKHASPERTRLNRIASELHSVRRSVDFHMKAAATAERRLLDLVDERETLKQLLRDRRLSETENEKNVFVVRCGR